MCLRGEEASSPGQDGHDDFAVGCNFVEGLCELVVLVFAEGVELCRLVKGYDGDGPLVLEFYSCHGRVQ